MPSADQMFLHTMTTNTDVNASAPSPRISYENNTTTWLPSSLPMNKTITMTEKSRDDSGGGGGSGDNLSTIWDAKFGCAQPEDEEWYLSSFGVKLAVTEWEAILTAFVLSIIIVLTIIGNILVILSVFTYKPLRIVQNFFIVSLAVADLTVALLVLPFNVAYSILGRWEFGIFMCKMWLTCDVLCCTSSILNLCAIALDRYWAITDPINYAQKRTVERVLLLIAGVWVLSLLISSPPLLGWNDWPAEFTATTPCELNSDPGYIIYSSLGSFFIPLIIMSIVYMEIFFATRRRLRERAQCTKMNTMALRSTATDNETGGTSITVTNGHKNTSLSTICHNFLCCHSNAGNISASMTIHNDQDSISSEANPHNETIRTPTYSEHRVVMVAAHKKKNRRAKIKDSIKHGKSRAPKSLQKPNTELSENSSKAGTSGTESLLQSSATTQEISTESATDDRGGTQTSANANATATATDNEASVEEIDEEKITPPQSSIGVVSLQATPLQKKSSGVYQFIEEKQKISLSKERRAARTLGIIMGVFVICWLPFFLMYVILPFCVSCCPTNKFKNFITWLGYINSVLNPIIYTIFNLDYRRAFKRLLGMQ